MRLIRARSVVRAHSGPPKKLSADECIQGIECSHEYLTKVLILEPLGSSKDIEKRIGEKQIKIRQMYDLSLDRKKFFKI